MYKKIAILALCFNLVMTGMALSYAEDDFTTYNETLYNKTEIDRIAQNAGVSLEYITKNGRDLYFNVELYQEKALKVYGNYADVIDLTGKNDFKVVSGGYYSKKDYQGEYRSHGYTAEGNLYNNNDFPRDSDSGRSVSEKEWMFRYWEEINETPNKITQKLVERWNDPYYAETKALADNLIDDVLLNSTYTGTDSTVDGRPGYAPSDHMNLYSVTSTQFNGEGKMMQENAGRLWYQIFSTNKVSNKEAVLQTCTVEIQNKGSYNFTGENTVPVDIKVTGVFHDKNMTSEVDEFTYYNKGDIKDYHLKLDIGSNSTVIEGKPNTTVDGNTAFTHTFTMNVSASDLDCGVMIFKGESLAKYYDGMVSETGKDQDVDNIGGGIKSIFTVDDIDKGTEETISKDQVKYLDSSVGEITRYSIIVENINTGTGDTFTYGSDSSAFVDDLYQFITADIATNKSYQVEQTVFNILGDSDTSMDMFRISQEALKAVEIDLDIPKDVIDVDDINASDDSDYSEVAAQSKTLTVDGVDVDWDKFFSGNYKVGELENDRLLLIEAVIVSEDGIESSRKTAIHVHSSAPRINVSLTGSTKINRKSVFTNNSASVSDPFVTTKYPSTYEYSYSVIGDADIDDFKRKVISANELAILFKDVGFYRITVKATNSIGRIKILDFDYGALPDYEPNVIFNIWNNVLTRDEALDTVYEANSLDGDVISSNVFEVYFDGDEDGVYEELIHTGSNPDFSLETNRLGAYKIVNYIEESFGEETIPEFITKADKKSKTVERYFYVDNLRPVTDIDLDIPVTLPEVDLYIMSDPNNTDANIATLRNNRINYNNDLRLYGLDVLANFRDLKTYTYTQPVNMSQFFGTTRPPSAIPYSNNGYNATLSKYNEVNNPVQDYYTTRESYEECITETTTKYVNCDKGDSYWDCRYVCSARYCDPYFCDEVTTTTESCTTEYETVRHYYMEDQWTGYYSGTAYKYVKQDYSNPFREQSDKYIVYVADNNFTLTDLNEMRNKAEYKLILIGSETLKSAVSDEVLFIKYDGSDLNLLMKQAIEYIGNEYPLSADYLLQVGDSFTIKEADFDTEGDTLIVHGYQYVQKEVYDNPMGLESFATDAYIADQSAFTNTVINQFNKVGKHEIYRLLSDSTGQINFDKDSNIAMVSALVHRKPIADYVLDWTYNAANLKYDVTFVDTSYDLDHQFSDTRRGIREFKAMYKLQGDLSWIYAIPSSLAKGTYEFRYSVKDMEGAWSDPKITTFTLSEVPPPQILLASLKTKDDKFSLNAIPGTEFLTFYDVKTRYPYDVKLSYGWFKDGVVVQPFKEVIADFDYVYGDRIWDSYDFEVPKILSDGSYTIELRIEDCSNSSNYASKFFDVSIFTPVELKTDTPEMILPGENRLTCTTSRYVDSVDMTLYHNTAYAESVTMNRISETSWEYVYPSSDSVPDNLYDVYYEASVHSNPYKTETQLDQTEKVSLRAESIIIRGAWQYWDGGLNIFGEQLTDEPHRFLSLEEIEILVETIGKPECIKIDMSVALKAMTYRDHQNNLYLYKELLGYEESFPLMMASTDKDNWSRYYVLPLAASTKSFENEVLTGPYYIKITLIKGTSSVEYLISDIHITGNTLDHLYLQPNE